MSNKFEGEGINLYCRTCPYIHRIDPEHDNVFTKTNVKDRKKVEDVFDNQWAGANTTKATCQKCGHQEAAFIEFQIRSADEPMTQFYKVSRAL
ncbi:hypothetical protein SmJEL517_g02028 [Synchytrium microbalum]|uniref:TFIIS-type domain-containing protein n=1 Tax=Synchytrium microbalum TaxID=1806994 RepID=A0A507C7R3_9FUNG|nr:uncharacterized protein SmJEL517_g02028 [Synchytrium microbalum]TPX35541.1 hypothetical protein SmJEL517_g02028 [Synchytrium microbalum]